MTRPGIDTISVSSAMPTSAARSTFDLRAEGEAQKFELLAQPIVSTLGHDRKKRIEILLSLTGAADSPVRAETFIGSMQQVGLTRAIDELVVRSTISMLESFEIRKLGPLLMCSINLAAPSLCDPQFQRFLVTQLARLAHPEQICFEVTENELIPNIQQAAVFMCRIKDIGCKFALDDFGNGLCSFSYLKHLPIDVVKIDGQFIRDCHHNRIDRHIVQAVQYMCRVIGAESVAECVESEHTYNVVRDIGVDFCQGYFFGRPVRLRHLVHNLAL